MIRKWYPPTQVSDIKEAERAVIEFAQRTFPKAIAIFKEKTCNPGNRRGQDDIKYPVILPKEGRIIDLVIMTSMKLQAKEVVIICYHTYKGSFG